MTKTVLAGKKIVVTRAEQQATGFVQKLESAGADIYQLPLITFERTGLSPVEREAICHFEQFDWIVFTSTNGVKFFMDALVKFKIEPKKWPKIAVVGKKTAEALSSYGLDIELKPTLFVAEQLSDELKEQVTNEQSVLIIRGRLGRKLLMEQLSKVVKKVVTVTIYHTVLPEAASSRFKHLPFHDIDLITFTSSSTVHHFARLLEDNDLFFEDYHWKVACIGPIAAKTCEQYHFPVTIMPSQFTVDDLLNSIIAYYEEEKSK
ncbi:hypothetical protein AJ85_09285 [Alkalihalobacillus alcalophilus ATCC 27647 = CGMCC 1.3604]|uniref:Uroporphyrinogen-III synthase n=1 Tax=Alkalihalobacillus alcalophilus ATCC 27647 = CGMCC 1.3604 TaxID=1218173 RepID=A0A4V3X8K9_ALKAL|nr:uroporphyrinogen-III synthase [Alkalihalobacillus alcalophilus]MED1561428.1 uroporphyrinogen-III synthase [Alkalihalobacillus alcalophilus]THG90702.1 hypothetical protein AJ85_09285 [Alkalihalobacillus alcalophilus ATCC 27647 = CGMCC 1.3604]